MTACKLARCTWRIATLVTVLFSLASSLRKRISLFASMVPAPVGDWLPSRCGIRNGKTNSVEKSLSEMLKSCYPAEAGTAAGK